MKNAARTILNTVLKDLRPNNIFCQKIRSHPQEDEKKKGGKKKTVYGICERKKRTSNHHKSQKVIGYRERKGRLAFARANYDKKRGKPFDNTCDAVKGPLFACVTLVPSNRALL